MKRCIVTFLGPGEKPLFDMILYGVTKDEFLRDVDPYTKHLDLKLRQRNLTLDDFEGILLSEPTSPSPLVK